MTLSEFKAWFEGFTEDMSGAPNKKQWDRIKARVTEITGQSVSYPVIIDQYIRPVRPYWDRVWCGNGIAGGATGAMGLANTSASTSAASFDSHSAMRAVGHAEALSMKAA
jgi:hypothetical protein